ncbi:MAG: hypothetical protein HKN22_07665 [Bacteroidia bacterium]|nr:hypothetical protein [Bacteroidia bacterium]
MHNMISSNSISELHSEHDEWQNKIKFYKGELSQFNTRLSDLVSKNSSPEILPSVEHFQNQFIRQREVLDIMRHDMKQHENAIEEKESEKVSPEDKIVKAHSVQQEKLDQFEKLFQELRNEFHLFLNKTPL